MPSEQWCCWMGGRRIISESAENRGNSCHRSDGSSMTNVRARTPAEVLARGRAASPGRRSSNANSLCGQNSAGSGQSERPFNGIFCDDVSEFESDHLSHAVGLHAPVLFGTCHHISQGGAAPEGRPAALCQRPSHAPHFWRAVFHSNVSRLRQSCLGRQPAP